MLEKRRESKHMHKQMHIYIQLALSILIQFRIPLMRGARVCECVWECVLVSSIDLTKPEVIWEKHHDWWIAKNTWSAACRTVGEVVAVVSLLVEVSLGLPFEVSEVQAIPS